MIVLNVIYQCMPGMRDTFLDALRTEGIGEACRAEAGNLKYDYYLPAKDRDEVLLVEKWSGTDALAAHGGQAHMAKLGELKKAYVINTVIEKYEV